MYITEYMSGLTVAKIAELHGRRLDSVSDTIHYALGDRYKGIDLRKVPVSEFKSILDRFELQ